MKNTRPARKPKKKNTPKREAENPQSPSLKHKKAAADKAALGSRSPFREIAEIAFYGLIILIFMKGFVWQNFQIPTKSMENSLLIGDHITANTFMFKGSAKWEKAIFPFRDPQRGDVIVFKYPGEDRQDWIKRLIGLPGDRFELRNDQLYVNGERLDQPFAYFKEEGKENDRDSKNANYPLNFATDKPGIDHANPDFLRKAYFDVDDLKARTRKTLTHRPFTNYRKRDQKLFKQILNRLESAPKGVIPEGFYVMMGDNRSYSADSRRWGMVPRELIEGRAYWIWWSYGEEEKSHEKRDIALIMSYVRVTWRIFTHTHFSRTFDLIR